MNNKSNRFSPEVRERAVRLGSKSIEVSTSPCGQPLSPSRPR